MGAHSATTDPQAALLQRVEEGLKAFNEANKNYIAAVRKVDSALEEMAVAFRQLSYGEMPPDLRGAVDTFGSTVALHRGAAAATGKGRNSLSDRLDGKEYAMVQYVDDFVRNVDSLGDSLKSLTKLTRVKHEEQEKVDKKYNEARAKTEKIAAADVKKNRNSAENPDYVKHVSKRDTLRKELTKKEEELTKVCRELQERRVEAIGKALSAMGELSSRYWSGVAQVMRSAEAAQIHGV
ncbi:uncharacterized protein Tco025E_07475 [Trypanosoma conorhini]|uniref:BAR domain-containing protein n=1 Tax=Trypanosoma conorhini TaxID=83891 RepID=A0A3R7KFW5_9TRYP|nr:uncharacterized protein Tco025E_07475 [Trypanosoma conorhini]RNF06963.1 hypothetical protein Tco025E_07475 [Trypanosoma conorhini]